MYISSLKDIPSINDVLEKLEVDVSLNRDFLKLILKKEIDTLRNRISEKKVYQSRENILHHLILSVKQKSQFSLRQVINGTGIVLHTGLGRAPFRSSFLKKTAKRIDGYSNLEFDLIHGVRGDRIAHIKNYINAICESEDSMIVNNNAGAVLLCLNQLADGGEVVCSRGQLVEIGGSFRIPDIIEKSGAVLKEVGTTNRTHLKDYEKAINSKTKLILQVHTSNYLISGYTKSVELSKLINLGAKYDIPVMSDWGSGSFISMEKNIGIQEATIKSILKKGPDLVTFSGDKLVGGPQSGLIVGKKKWVSLLKENTLYRTLRCNKIVISLLEETLRTYKSESFKKDNLSLMLLSKNREDLKRDGEKILSKINREQVEKYNIHLTETLVEAGSGSSPEQKLESMALSFQSDEMRVDEIAKNFRMSFIPVVGYISENTFYIDLKALLPKQNIKLVKIINDL